MIRLRVLGVSVASASLALAVIWLARPALGQQNNAAQDNPLQGIAALEEATVTAIAEAERSVVAIALVRRRENQPIDFGVSPLGRMQIAAQASPGTPEFIPNEYATGVVVGADGDILTAHHVLQEDCDYWVTTPDRKIYKARIKG
ncbi:MAG: trypsin-like peptidase domain-containing protein, partial [Pirellulales bacterium]